MPVETLSASTRLGDLPIQKLGLFFFIRAVDPSFLVFFACPDSIQPPLVAVPGINGEIFDGSVVKSLQWLNGLRLSIPQYPLVLESHPAGPW